MAEARKKLNVDKVLTQIVELLGRYSVAALSFSRVSQLTGIPRSTLYYYFGNSKEGMLAEAVRFGMKGYVQLISLEKKRRQYPDWQTFQRARLRVAAATVRRYPWAPTLYFRFRGDPGLLGDAVREIEMRYARELAETWKKYHGGRAPDESAVRLSAFIKLGFLWGLATDPDYWYRQIGKKKLGAALDAVTEVASLMMGKKI